MTRQPTSLLSLPDELLVQIFDYLAEPLRGPGHPLLAVFTVCRRVHKVAKPLLYRHVIPGKYVGATSHVEAAIQQNPSLGQLVSNLELHDYGSFHLAYDRGELTRTEQATLRAFTKLTRLTVAMVEPDEAASTLAALPPTPLKFLDMRLIWTEERSYWQDLQTQLFRFSGLRILKCEDLDLQSATSYASVLAREHRLSAQRLSLPALLELHMTDYIFLAIIGGSGPLRQILPSLLALHLTITRPENALAISARLSLAPSSLAKVAISLEDFTAVERQWLSTFPVVRSLEISSSVLESDLLAYLASATTLESISFKPDVGVTDHLLRALTGVRRPPRLRHIHLDHVDGSTTDEIAEQLGHYNFGDLHAVEYVRQTQAPRWPVDGTADGLQLALADANANGIRVTGTALDCIRWHANFDRLLVDRMLKQARDADDYAVVIARFGEEVAIAWLKQHAPNTVSVFRAKYMGDFNRENDGVPE